MAQSRETDLEENQLPSVDVASLVSETTDTTASHDCVVQKAMSENSAVQHLSLAGSSTAGKVVRNLIMDLRHK
jgi:hypothetical protein